MKNTSNNTILVLVKYLLVLICFVDSGNIFGQQYTNTGYHHDHANQGVSESDVPSVCNDLQTLLKHHDYDQVHQLVFETLKENPLQADCFFHSARIYFTHKLSGREKHSQHLFDSLMVMYDKWFAVSRNPYEVLNNKGKDVRDYYYKQPDSLRKYCALYKRIYDADKEHLHPYNLKMMAFCACDLHGKVNIDSLFAFTKQKAMMHHDHLWKAPYRSLKRELIKCPKMNCNQLHSYLHPDMVTNREGSEETQQVGVLLVQRGCATPAGVDVKTAVASNSPKPADKSEVTETVTSSTAAKVTREVYKEPEPEKVPVSNFVNLYRMADNQMSRKLFADALGNYRLALSNAGSPIEKSDAYLGMAEASDSLKDYKKAKEFGIEAHKLLPDETDALKFLSSLYQKGEHVCNFSKAKEQAAYYILLSEISWALSSSEESDAWKENANLKELYKSGEASKGDKVHLGCFINEDVVLP